MTKVISSPSILAYRQAMAQLVDQVCDEHMIVDEDRQRPEELREFRTEVRELWMPGLLGSPTIEALWPDLVLQNGHLDGLIQINTSDVYGVMHVYVILEDDRGNRIEDEKRKHRVMMYGAHVIPTMYALPGTQDLRRFLIDLSGLTCTAAVPARACIGNGYPDSPWKQM